MVYDDVNKKWIPSGSSSGLSKVQLYHHQVNNTFRVVGRKLQDHEIVINCAILKGLKYNQATVTFHQWRDNKQVYGLNFSSKDDADAFARAMLQALDVIHVLLFLLHRNYLIVRINLDQLIIDLVYSAVNIANSISSRRKKYFIFSLFWHN